VRYLSVVFGVFFTLAVAGCDSQSVMDRFVPQAESAVGKSYVESIRTRNFAPIEADFNPAYEAEVRPAMEKMAGLFPNEEPKSIKTVGSHWSLSGEASYNFTYEYEFSDRWILGAINFKKLKNKIQIERMDVVLSELSLEEANAFSFKNRDIIHYLFIVAAIAFATFTVGTAIVCARTKGLKRKWLWIIFVLIGLGWLQLNWTTGAINYGLAYITFFASGFSKPFYGPLVIQIGFPIGAIVFWLRRRKWQAATAS